LIIARGVALERGIDVGGEHPPDLRQPAEELRRECLGAIVAIPAVQEAIVGACVAEAALHLLPQEAGHAVEVVADVVAHGLGAQLGGSEVAREENRLEKVQHLVERVDGGHGHVMVAAVKHGHVGLGR
jgi:hypothetical protein